MPLLQHRSLAAARQPARGPANQRNCALAEESDADGAGGHASHFELYHAAMVQCGAHVRPIDELVERLRAGEELATALHSAKVPSAAAQFVRHTFSVIATGDLPAIAAAFTFGREDLLPDVFQCIVDELNEELGGGLAQFRYYLHRHIDLDGDEHGPAATAARFHPLRKRPRPLGPRGRRRRGRADRS